MAVKPLRQYLSPDVNNSGISLKLSVLTVQIRKDDLSQLIRLPARPFLAFSGGI
jgi:hypothetical protein